MSIYDSKTYAADLAESRRNTADMEALRGKSVLITGSTGTIGSFLADVLLKYNADEGAGIRVLAGGRDEGRVASRFAGAYAQPEFVYCDLTQPFTYDGQVDYIIAAAGNAHPASFNGDPVGTIIGNIDGTKRLLDFAAAKGTKRLLYVSSGEVYGQGDLSLEAFEETYGGYLDPTSPRSCYPMSKRAAETLCASYTKQYGLSTVIVRPCHTYGPFITPSDNRANAQFLRLGASGEDIVMKSAGTQMRSYCYMADCAANIFTALIKGEDGEAYNSANADARVTIAGFAQAIAGAAETKVVFENPSELDIANQTPIAKQVLDTKKIQALGVKHSFPVDRGVRHTLAIMRGE